MGGPRFEVEEDEVGKYRFELVAPNNEVIAVSKGFTTTLRCKVGVEAVKEYAPEAKVIEK